MEIEIVHGKFEEFLKTEYPNENTRKNYLFAEQRFMKLCGNPDLLTQFHISRWVGKARQKNNPLNYGFIKAYMRCYDPEGTYGLKINKTRSAQYKPAKEYRFMEYSDIMQLIEILTPKLSLIVRLMFETGLRRSELINIHRKDIDFHDRIISGIGKRNKEFKVHFSENTSELLQKWILENEIDRPEKLFVFYSKNNKKIVKDQGNRFWELLREEAENAGFHKVHPHRIRHSLGRFLRLKGFDMEQIRVKLRHDSLNTTQIYTEATLDEVHKKEDQELFGK